MNKETEERKVERADYDFAMQDLESEIPMSVEDYQKALETISLYLKQTDHERGLWYKRAMLAEKEIEEIKREYFEAGIQAAMQGREVGPFEEMLSEIVRDQCFQDYESTKPTLKEGETFEIKGEFPEGKLTDKGYETDDGRILEVGNPNKNDKL